MEVSEKLLFPTTFGRGRFQGSIFVKLGSDFNLNIYHLAVYLRL